MTCTPGHPIPAISRNFRTVLVKWNRTVTLFGHLVTLRFLLGDECAALSQFLGNLIRNQLIPVQLLIVYILGPLLTFLPFPFPLEWEIMEIWKFRKSSTYLPNTFLFLRLLSQDPIFKIPHNLSLPVSVLVISIYFVT